MKDFDLLAYAREAAKKAYAPYSNIKIGAAVLSDDGKVFCGCNVENASYGATVCAERNAIFSAVAAGTLHISEIAVFSSDVMPYPCGICRQVMSEFATSDVTVWVSNGEKTEKFLLSALLPNSFGE